MLCFEFSEENVHSQNFTSFGFQETSVTDPNPSDPYIFGPPGFGSGSISPDLSIIKQK
jgi:hypothetical protein